MSKYIALESNKTILTFAHDTGNVQALVRNKINIQLAGGALFTVGLRSGVGDMEILSSNDFQFEWSKLGESLIFKYSHHICYNTLNVSVVIRTEKDFFYFRPEIENIPHGLLLEWIDVPQILVPAGGNIFWPHMEGILIDKPNARECSPWSRYHVLGFLGHTEGNAYSEGGYYPGVCQMQFLSWQNEGMAIYFAAHDHSHGTKAVEFAPLPDGRCRFSLQTFCGGGDPYRSSFEYVLGLTEGDWRDACKVYREWIANDPALPERGALPEMIKDSPVVMIYPVRGHGDDKGYMSEGNEYFPYGNAMPVVRKYANLFDSKILSLLMHWEGTAPWAPPYVWPPLGGEDQLQRYCNELHAEKHYLGVYCSGSAWTQKSCIIDYSCEKKCDEQGLRKHMIRGPKGEIDAVICNGEKAQRFGFDMCLTEEWSRQTLLDELSKIASCDIDYVQFFDQNLGGAYHACYSRDHKHPAVPGAWQTEAMSSLLGEMQSILKKHESKIILGCEGASADAYLNNLPFNDLRSCWNWGRGGIPVPAYQFVFHEYCNNFMGNQCGVTNTINCESSKENLLFRIAYAFDSGDLFSIVLKEAGKIHWGWGASWEMSQEPKQDEAITLIRNLNMRRKEYGKFLQYGRMEKPRIKLECDKYYLWVNEERHEFPACFHSAWVSPDGEWGEVITNFLPHPQKVCLGGVAADNSIVQVEIPPLDAVCFPLENIK